MAWYAAHILMRMRYRHGPDEPHYLMENIVLVEAASPAEARVLAERRGQADTNEDDPAFTCDGRPAYWAFAGVRLLMSCSPPDVQPTSGTELTYLEYRAASSDDVERLLAGHAAVVEYG